MQFKIGDLVGFPTYGIGHIKEIEEKNFSEQGARLYYKIALSNRTIWIPVEAHEVSGLRLITAKSDLDYYRSLLKSPPVPLEKNYYRRHNDLTSRLKQGSFQVMCEVVRDLTGSGWQKPLGRSDATLLQETRKRLLQEWATSASVSMAKATSEIDTLLLESRQVYFGLI